MDSSIAEKRKAEIVSAKIMELNAKESLPKLSGVNLQTVSGGSHPGRMYKQPSPVPEEIKEEKGIFDTMVEELPQVEEDIEEDGKKKKHPGFDKTRIYQKRKQNAKRAKQARKKQRKKK